MEKNFDLCLIGNFISKQCNSSEMCVTVLYQHATLLSQSWGKKGEPMKEVLDSRICSLFHWLLINFIGVNFVCIYFQNIIPTLPKSQKLNNSHLPHAKETVMVSDLIPISETSPLDPPKHWVVVNVGCGDKHFFCDFLNWTKNNAQKGNHIKCTKIFCIFTAWKKVHNSQFDVDIVANALGAICPFYLFARRSQSHRYATLCHISVAPRKNNGAVTKKMLK